MQREQSFIGLQFLKYTKVLRWLREDPISWLLIFSFFFCFILFMRLLFLGTKASCSASYGENKPINANRAPASPLHGKY